MFDWSPVSPAGRRRIRYNARGHGRSISADEPALFEWPSVGKDLFGLADTLAPGEKSPALGPLWERPPCSGPPSTIPHGSTDWSSLQLHSTRDPCLDGRSLRSKSRDGGARRHRRFAARSASLPVPAPFSHLPSYPPPLDVDPALLPTVLRGGARSDLPPLELLRRIHVPVLLRSWTGDPGHPVSSGELLADTIPGARFEVSGSTDEILKWGHTAADFLETKAG